MIRIKALNDQSGSSDSSDSDYHPTREAEEEELNKSYLNALQHASKGNLTTAIDLLENLVKEFEDDSKVKDAVLLKSLKYLTYKNLGLFKDDLELILDALEIDDSDINLWIAAGRKAKEKQSYLLSKICFENAYQKNPLNYIVMDNLMEVYFILDHIYSCVNMCFRALNFDDDYMKAKILLNECIKLMPPIVKDIDQVNMVYVSAQFGGDDDLTFCDPQVLEYSEKIIEELFLMKRKRFLPDNDQNENSNKRPKLSLILENKEKLTLEKIGTKIYSIHQQIKAQSYNICTPVEIVFEESEEQILQVEKDHLNTNNSNVDQISVKDQANESQESASADSLSKNKIELNEESREVMAISRKEMLALYENIDKRRSSRSKSKSNKNSDDFEDDQSLSSTLIQLLPMSLKTWESQSSTNESNSTSLTENIEIKSKAHEAKAVEKFLSKLNTLNDQKPMTVDIWDLISLYLIEISSNPNVKIPKVFSNLYKIYREFNELPNGLLCKIGKDISIEMIFVCLTANEIDFNRDEIIFLKQILLKLSVHLTDLEKYRQFLIRFFVLCGSKELDTDLLHYAHDFFELDSKFFKHFSLSNDGIDSECLTFHEFIAPNRITINSQYISTLIDMQSACIFKLSEKKNYTEIIRLFFSKPAQELTEEEKIMLNEAIVKTEQWQKGIDLLQNWPQLDEGCLLTILECVKSGKRAHLTPKLAKKIVSLATETSSSVPWLILYWSIFSQIERLDDESADDKKSDSFLINQPLIRFLQIGHSVLGKHGLCTERNGQFLWKALKIFIKYDFEEEALKCCSCLFDFPSKKVSQQSNVHNSPQIELKWSHCREIYSYFVPEYIPEFDSSARQSGIPQETKDFFKKILKLIPDELKLKNISHIKNYINNGQPLTEFSHKGSENPKDSVLLTIYYLIGDYYFKTQDFDQAREFYIKDLALSVDRFDSWAGLSLSINYQLDQMLINGSNTHSVKFHQTAFATMQCFDRALQLQPDNRKMLLEFGLLCYNLASNWFRLLKRNKVLRARYEPSEPYYKIEEILEKSRSCFQKVVEDINDNDESWLANYMLGKIAEKTKENILTILQYYELADWQLYLEGAQYPKKIVYNNYSTAKLSLEALEIHYRIHCCILKFLVNNRKFSARLLRQLWYHLVKTNRSPFVLCLNSNTSNKNSKKRDVNAGKLMDPLFDSEHQIRELVQDLNDFLANRELPFDVIGTRNKLMSMCVIGIKRCLARYASHYKSYYRLAWYYFIVQDINTAKSILLGGNQNKNNVLLRMDSTSDSSLSSISNTSMSKESSSPLSTNFIKGLFYQPTNLFNNVWRIPVDEIERAGNFNAHMFRCTNFLIDLCTTIEDHQLLSVIAFQLHKTPEHYKKYLHDSERMKLAYKAFKNCFQVLREQLIKSNASKSSIEECLKIKNNLARSNIFEEEAKSEFVTLQELIQTIFTKNLIELQGNTH